MRKVIKYFLHTVSLILLAAIAVPLFAGLMLYLPPVQKFAVGRLVGMLSSKTGTTVSVDRLRVGLFNRVSVSGFYVEDMQGDTLLYADKVEVGLSIKGLTGSTMELGDVSLSGVQLRMHQDPDSTSNLKKIILRLRNPDKPKSDKPFALRARSLSIEDMDYSFHKLDIEPRDGVNFTDIDVEGFDLEARNISVNGDSIAMRIGLIAFRDKSGFQVNDFSAKNFSISPVGQFYEDLHIVTPDSEVNLEHLRLHTGEWSGYSDFINVVRMEGDLRDSRVSFRTIGYFAPSLKRWQSVLSRVDATVEGTVADMSGRIGHAEVKNTSITAGFAMKGLPDVDRTHFKFDIDHLSTDIDDVGYIIADITGKPLSESVTVKAERLGRMDLTADFDGTFSDFDAAGHLVSEDGTADFDLSFVPAANRMTAIHGNVAVNGINAGSLLGSAQLGHVTMTLGADGKFSKGAFAADIDMDLASLVFNGYRYHDITMDGLVKDRLFRGKIASKDPNIDFDFDGTLDFNDSIPRYDFDMRLRNADLHKLNFNKRDSVSLLKLAMVAAARGSGLDNLNGSITIDRMLYVNHLDSVRTGRMRLIGENNDEGKYLSFTSDFTDAEYRSRTSYGTVIHDLREMLGSYVPTLASSGRARGSSSAVAADAANYSLLKVNVKQANNIAGIFLPGLIVAQGTRLSFMFNPNIKSITLTAASDYLEYGNNFVTKLDMSARNQADSLSLFLRADDIYTAGIYMPDLSVLGGVRENRINVQARTQDTARRFSALLGVSTTLQRDTLTGRPQARLRFMPSNLVSGDKTWTIFARSVLIDSTMVDIRSFGISGPDQSLRVNGRLSKDPADTLHLDLRRFELEPLSQLTSRMGYKIKGNATGHADMVTVLSDPKLDARIEFDSIKVNEVPIPAGLFRSRWDFENNRAGFLLTGKETGDTVVRGFFRPKEKRYVANIKLHDLDMSLLNPLFEGVISKTQGLASAEATLRGESGQMNFNGYISVPRLTTTVDFLNVPYTIQNARISIKDNILTLPNTPLKDPLGNTAAFDMSVNLSSLSNVRYQFNVRPSNFMVLNTGESDNDLFYGRVFATGTAAIRGDRAGVKMDITASTAGNSEFYLPLSNASTMGVSDIITFVAPEHMSLVDSSDYLVRKRLIMERRSKRQEKAAGESSSVAIAMSLNVLPNTEFQLLIDPRVGDIMRGRGAGSLTMNVNTANDEFTMYGDYELQEGSYMFTLQDIIRKRFIIDPGSRIVWTGDPADALLDVTAVYKLKASLQPLLNPTSEKNSGVPTSPVSVVCKVLLGDRLSNPSVNFSVEVPDVSPELQAQISNALGTQESMSTQFVMLLAANSFYSGSGAGNIGASGGAATAFEFLSSQLGNIISNDNFDVGIRYTPGTDSETSDEVSLDFSTALFSNRLLLEAEGNYDTGSNPNATNRNASNLTGDFSLTWLIDKSGSLRAKGFTRTVEDFGENQGLQEHGIGISYQESFNTFSDIARNFRERFANWGKKKKKAAEQTEDDDEADGKGGESGETNETASPDSTAYRYTGPAYGGPAAGEPSPADSPSGGTYPGGEPAAVMPAAPKEEE